MGLARATHNFFRVKELAMLEWIEKIPPLQRFISKRFINKFANATQTSRPGIVASEALPSFSSGTRIWTHLPSMDLLATRTTRWLTCPNGLTCRTNTHMHELAHRGLTSLANNPGALLPQRTYLPHGHRTGLTCLKQHAVHSCVSCISQCFT